MAVNLEKNHDSLLGAWKEVTDDKNPTDWALFGYEGQTNDLKLVSKGDGGLEEMQEDLSSGKIMYAFCRVIDPQTSLHKFILINWQGEGAQSSRKGTCAGHLQDLSSFFRPHLTLNARIEEEVETELILSQVAKASGSVYRFDERGDLPDAGPVGTTYKRVVPSREIDIAARDTFWEKEEVAEKRRLEEEKVRRTKEREREEGEIKYREAEGSKRRLSEIEARSKAHRSQQAAENQAFRREQSDRDLLERRRWEEQQTEELQEAEVRKGRDHQLSRQRSQEAMVLIGNKALEAKAVFERNTSAGQLSRRRLSSSALSSMSSSGSYSPEIHRKGSLPTWNTDVTALAAMANNVTKQIEAPSVASNGMSSNVATSPNSTDSNHSGVTEELHNLSLQEENHSVITEQNHSSIVMDYNHMEFASQENHHLSPTILEESPEQESSPSIQSDVMGEEGLKVRALYDYQAADETEISFDPGDILINVDQIDEGWWQGLAPDGSYGLFPANYVELLQ